MDNTQKPASALNRRRFIKTSSAASAAAVGTLAMERFAHAAADDTLKLALIGCGGRGTGAANQALSTSRLGMGNIKLVAMADAFEDNLLNKLSIIREQHRDLVDVPPERQFVGFDAYKKAIAEADVVILTTPPGFRPIHFEEAVKQGKNIFMEKPVATDAVGIRKVLEAAKEAKKKNLKVGVGLQRHHQVGYIETIKRLQDGAIGDITSMRCYWNGNGVWTRARADLEKAAGRKLTEMEYQMRNWYYFNWLCGDHINEQHIHNIDVINWIKGGYPVSAQGMGGRQVRDGIDNGEIFDHHFVEFEYADGSRCYSQCRHIRGCFNSVSEHVTGTMGRSDVNKHMIYGDNRWRHKPAEGQRDPNPYQQEWDDLIAAIRKNEDYNEAEYGAKSTMTSILGRMATYSGKVVSWEEGFNSDLSLLPEKFSWDANPKSMPDKDGRYEIPVPGAKEWIDRIL
jgi:predicted dehydrogenase